MKVSKTVFEIGSQLEYFSFSIRAFDANSYKVAPIISTGLIWESYDAESSTNFGAGDISDPPNLPEKYSNAFGQQQGNTPSFADSIGVRYKLTHYSELILDTTWQYCFSDWVDGLNPSFDANNTVLVPENHSNDWIFLAQHRLCLLYKLKSTLSKILYRIIIQ